MNGYADGYESGFDDGKYVAVHEEQFDAPAREIDLLDVDGIYATENDGCDW